MLPATEAECLLLQRLSCRENLFSLESKGPFSMWKYLERLDVASVRLTRCLESANLLQGIGHSLSGYASIILKSDEEAGNGQDGTAFPVHPDSLHKQAAPVDKLPSLSRAKTPGDEWFERLNVGPRTPTSQASVSQTLNLGVDDMFVST